MSDGTVLINKRSEAVQWGSKLEKRFGTLLDVSPDAMVFVERSGIIVLVNEQMANLFGYSREELIGSDLHMLIPERYHDVHRKNISFFFSESKKRVMGTGLKIYGRRKNGSEFRADISLSPLESDGEIFVAAAVRDITERVLTEEKIEFDNEIQKAINALLKVALEPISIDQQLAVSLDLILSLSQLALQSIGSIYLIDETSETLILMAQQGMPANILNVCSQLPLDRQSGNGAESPCRIAYTECINTPSEILRKSGGFYTPYCIPISDGNKVLGLINVFAKGGHREDPEGKAFLNAVAKTMAVIIQRYWMETEKHKLLDKLAQAEKLAALGRISANVAHEIRNPLTVVGGFARRLKKRSEDEDRKTEYIDFIVAEVSRLEEILKDILTFARAKVPDLKANRVHEIVDEVLKVFENSCMERSIQVIRSYEFTSELNIDGERVHEIIVNLVSNAVVAIGSNGTITISTTNTIVNGMDYAIVKISDSGEGIPQENLDKIFEPFFTTKVSTRGVGLGLSICKKIMEDHGGFITAASSIGKGSAFTLHFPLDR